MNIPLARPDITEAEYAGAHYAVAVNSGTSALHVIIEFWGSARSVR